VSALLSVDSTSTTDPDPYVVDGDVPRSDEFSRRRPPEFELDGETQLKVPAPPLKELELPEHVNVLFLQTVEDINLPEDTVGLARFVCIAFRAMLIVRRRLCNLHRFLMLPSTDAGQTLPLIYTHS